MPESAQQKRTMTMVLLATLAAVLVVVLCAIDAKSMMGYVINDRVLFHADANTPAGASLVVGKQNFFLCSGEGEFPLLNGSLVFDQQASFFIYEYTTHQIDPRNAVYPSNGWLNKQMWNGDEYSLLRFTRGRYYYVWTKVPLRMTCGTGLSIDGGMTDGLSSSSPISSALSSSSQKSVTSAKCGNFILETGEQCEVGIACGSGLGCDVESCTCTQPDHLRMNIHACGNGRLEPGEDCETGITLLYSPCTGNQSCNLNTCRCPGNASKLPRGKGILNTNP